MVAGSARPRRGHTAMGMEARSHSVFVIPVKTGIFLIHDETD